MDVPEFTSFLEFMDTLPESGVSVLTLTACGAPRLDHGTVTGKRYVPSREYVVIYPLYAGQTCTGGGSKYSSQVCTPRYIYIPWWVKTSDHWQIDLLQGKRKGYAYVPESEYQTIRIGQRWSLHPGASLTPPKPVKVKKA